jgi:hypothetical protein
MPGRRSRTRLALDDLLAEILLDRSLTIILIMAIVNIVVWLVRLITGIDLLAFPFNLLVGAYDVLSLIAIIRLRLIQILK